MKKSRSGIPFRNLSRLIAGDFFAKLLYFLAFIYLARTLGVSSYGTIEFALSILAYFLIFADGGLEWWATRETARGADAIDLVSRIVPLRLLFALAAFALLLVLRSLLPDYPGLDAVLTLFGLTLFSQAVNLKWLILGSEKMSRVAIGLVVGEIIFSAGCFLFVRSDLNVLWVPILRFAAEFGMATYFGRYVATSTAGGFSGFTLRGASEIIRPSLTMGAAHGLATMSYNFDSVLLGFMKGSDAVGWYAAAYKPITAALAFPIVYFRGLFPTLSRTFQNDRGEFAEVATRSMSFAAILALPIGVGGTLLAEPMIDFLFGSVYANSVLPVRILSWTAALVIMRGTYRQSFNAAGRQDLDFRCATISIALNIGLNLFLIDRHGIVGAAVATLMSELLWFGLASRYFHLNIIRVNLFAIMWRSIAAASTMALFLIIAQPLNWIVSGILSTLVYFGALLLVRETTVLALVQTMGKRSEA